MSNTEQENELHEIYGLTAEQNNQLRQALETYFKEQVLEKDSALQEDQNFIDSVVNETMKSLEVDGKDFEDKLEHLNQPETKAGVTRFMQVAAALGPGNEAAETLDKEVLAKLTGNKTFMEEFKKIMENDDLTPKQKIEEFREKIKEHFGAEQAKEIDKHLDTFFDQMKNELKNKFGDTLNDAAQKDLEMKTPELNKYGNLMGLLSSQTGGMSFPIQCYLGNGLGFNDWNPNQGDAPIDRINNVNDNQFGDSLSLNAMAAANFSKIPDTKIDQFSSLLKSFGLESQNKTYKSEFEKATSITPREPRT